MNGARKRIVVIAYAHARLMAYLVSTDTAGWKRLGHLLDGLRALGRVAWYTCQLPPEWSSDERTVDAIAGMVGRMTVDAALASPPFPAEAAPAWLMPVWPFDHRIAGMPASTADLMGMSLELRASPCNNEEGGLALPGWPGRWWIDATSIRTQA